VASAIASPQVHLTTVLGVHRHDPHTVSTSWKRIVELDQPPEHGQSSAACPHCTWLSEIAVTVPSRGRGPYTDYPTGPFILGTGVRCWMYISSVMLAGIPAKSFYVAGDLSDRWPRARRIPARARRSLRPAQRATTGYHTPMMRIISGGLFFAQDRDGVVHTPPVAHVFIGHVCGSGPPDGRSLNVKVG